MFTPRNINQRIKDYEIIKAKELNKYEDFFKEFEDNLKDIQNKTSSDLKEQLFIDLIKDCQIIKYQHETIKFRILLKNNGNTIFLYDYKFDWFLYSEKFVWYVFKSKFNIQHEDFIKFLMGVLDKYFFKPGVLVFLNN